MLFGVTLVAHTVAVMLAEGDGSRLLVPYSQVGGCIGWCVLPKLGSDTLHGRMCSVQSVALLVLMALQHLLAVTAAHSSVATHSPGS